jgi:lysyl-tRNA synthetase class II
MFNAMRSFFNRGLEVETPVLQPIPGAATPIYHAPQLA